MYITGRNLIIQDLFSNDVNKSLSLKTVLYQTKIAYLHVLAHTISITLMFQVDFIFSFSVFLMLVFPAKDPSFAQRHHQQKQQK